MLILQRKAGEALLIGDNIKISILEIGTDKVKLAIDAPKNIPILRTELLDAAESNREAAQSSKDSISSLKNILKFVDKTEEKD